MTPTFSVVLRSRAKDSTPATCRYRMTGELFASNRTRVLRPIRTRSPSLGTRLAFQVSGADHGPLFTDRNVKPTLPAFACARAESLDPKATTIVSTAPPIRPQNPLIASPRCDWRKQSAELISGNQDSIFKPDRISPFAMGAELAESANKCPSVPLGLRDGITDWPRRNGPDASAPRGPAPLPRPPPGLSPAPSVPVAPRSRSCAPAQRRHATRVTSPPTVPLPLTARATARRGVSARWTNRPSPPHATRPRLAARVVPALSPPLSGSQSSCYRGRRPGGRCASRLGSAWRRAST